MTPKYLLFFGLLTALLASCQDSETRTDRTEGSAPSLIKEGASPSDSAPPQPAPPSAEVLAALRDQEFGRKLLGKTMFLVGDKLVQADLPHAPEYYLLHYSASW